MLEVSVADLQWEKGKFHVKGDPSAAVTIADIAMRAHGAGDLPEGIEGGLDAEVCYSPSNLTYPYVVHQRSAQTVAVLVEGNHLHQRHADAVDDAAVYLTLDDHRVDPGSAIIDGQKAPHLHHRGARVDVDHTEVGA